MQPDQQPDPQKNGNGICERARGSLYNVSLGRAVPARCKSWRCEACRPAKARRVMRRFTRGHWKKFLTITMPPGHGWPKRPNLRYQAAALRRLWRGLHQHFGDFEAAWIREIGAVTNCICKKRGWHDPAPYSELNPVARGAFHELLDCQCGAGGERLHLHAVVSIERWIDPQLLSRLATRAGFGFVDVRAVRSAGVRDYLTEYLAKAPPPGAGARLPRADAALQRQHPRARNRAPALALVERTLRLRPPARPHQQPTRASPHLVERPRRPNAAHLQRHRTP